MEEFVAVVAGKGGRTKSHYHSSLVTACLELSFSETRHLGFLDLMRSWECVRVARSCGNSEGVVGERLNEGTS